MMTEGLFAQIKEVNWPSQPALSNLVLREHNYVFEPTGADSPSQNRGG
jgi:hypothetical protein